MPKCEICNDGKEYVNLDLHKKRKHVSGEYPTTTENNSQGSNPEEPKTEPNTNELLIQLMGMVKGIDKRVSDVEAKTTGKENAFKKGIKQEDIINAEITRKNVDEKIVKIVDETLGEDFGVDIETRQDQPGFLFTLIVPQRLSDAKISSRPRIGDDGKYLLDDNKLAITEEYYPEDRRSRAIASYQSYDAIRNHCEKVRAYIVSHYQRLNQPIPEFRLKQYI